MKRITQHLRKFWIAETIIIGASILCGIGKIAARDYIYIVITIAAYFKIANSAEKKQ